MVTQCKAYKDKNKPIFRILPQINPCFPSRFLPRWVVWITQEQVLRLKKAVDRIHFTVNYGGKP